MDFELSDEQRAFAETARAFAREEWLPQAPGWDERGEFPVAALRAAAELGFAGIYVGEEFGGSGLGRLDATVIFEELAAACVSTAAYLSIHNMAAWMIDRFGTREQRARFLPKLTTMAHFASYCLTEPGSGSDAAALATKAVRDGDKYVLNGTKAFISGGSVSDVYVAMVRTGGAGAKGISCLVVEKDAPGLSFGKKEKKLGWNSQPTAMVMFEDCRVPVANRIGDEGAGFPALMNQMPQERLILAVNAVVQTEKAVQLTLAYTKERKVFGKPLYDQQNTRFVLAECATLARAARLFIDHCIVAHARGQLDNKTAAMAKWWLTDVQCKVLDECVQLFGGYGYMEEYPIARMYADARVQKIYGGANEIMKEIIARAL